MTEASGREWLPGVVSRRSLLKASALVAVAGVSVPRLGKNQQTFFGLDVPFDDPATVDDISSLVGATPSVVSLFLKLDSDVPVARLQQMSAAKQTPFVTLEPWLLASKQGQVNQPGFSLGSIIRGDHDAAFRRLASGIGAIPGPIFIRFAHEMNAWWYPWCEAVNGNRPGQYIRAWRHVRQVFARSTNRGFRWVWSPNVLLDVTRTLPTLKELYPGDRAVDYVGMTGYSHGGSSPATTFGPTLVQLRALSSRPVVLSEIGANGPAAPTWVRGLAGYLAANRQIQGFVYFDTSPGTTGATGNYSIRQSPAMVAAFRSMVRAIGANRTR